ncbi:MAG: Anaphase-promoting complex subunit 5 [Pycnora praestabilis]|nr:MAG: Anaphase-promoting complex subunit 5 [Pycnora praestabilis]
MARYLTAPKIGLLALISLYTDSVVPTTSTIAVLSFLISHLIPPSKADRKTSTKATETFVRSIQKFQEALITHASGIPGRTVWDLFLKKIWDINSFDSLHVFFDDLSLSLAKTRDEQGRDAERGIDPVEDRILLSRASPLGAFVRRAQLEFTRLQFHDTEMLWKAFIMYREPTLPMWKKRNAAAGRTSFDVNLQGLGLGVVDGLTEVVYGTLTLKEGFEGMTSTDDVERLLEFQIEEMQKLGNRVPEELKETFRSMTDSNVTIPSISHYVRFLDSWRAGDYPSSFDNLHRYFDYTMHSCDRTFYQYALLNLAILQADFGCFSESIAAMQETITTARENKDMACLNFSLSWLYHFGKAHPGDMNDAAKGVMLGVEREGLAFLKAKAKETGMWSLLSTSLLSEAKLGLTNGESVPQAFENIIKASHVNITKNVTNAVGSQMLLQSSIFGRLGVSYLSWSFCETFLRCYAKEAPLEEVVKCMVDKGRYEDAMNRMEEVDTEFLRTLKFYQYWATFSGLLKLRRELHRNNLEAAERLLTQLLASPAPDPDISYTLSLLRVDLLIRRRSYTLALSTLEDLATNLQTQSSDIFYRVRLLSLKASLLSKCGRPEKGFSVAVRAANIAHKSRLLPALWEAIGAVSNVLISLREFDAASKLLTGVIPQALECEDCELSARLYSFIVDAQMGLAGQATMDSPKRKERLTKALEYIDCSFAEFSRIEDIEGQCEMMAKKAIIMHLFGDLLLANDYAAKYMDLKRKASLHG